MSYSQDLRQWKVVFEASLFFGNWAEAWKTIIHSSKTITCAYVDLGHQASCVLRRKLFNVFRMREVNGKTFFLLIDVWWWFAFCSHFVSDICWSSGSISFSTAAPSFPQDNTTTFQTKGFPIDFSRIIALFVYFFWIHSGVPNDNPNDNETITKKSQNPYRPDTGPFVRWKPVFLGAYCSSKMSKQAQDMAGFRCFLNELLQHETEGGQLIAEAQEAVPGKAQPGKKRWNDPAAACRWYGRTL